MLAVTKCHYIQVHVCTQIKLRAIQIKKQAFSVVLFPIFDCNETEIMLTCTLSFGDQHLTLCLSFFIFVQVMVLVLYYNVIFCVAWLIRFDGDTCLFGFSHSLSSKTNKQKQKCTGINRIFNVAIYAVIYIYTMLIYA